jgi:PPOX class probable F420-dependent enzyme
VSNVEGSRPGEQSDSAGAGGRARRSIRLTADEAWDALARAHTGVLTTLRADGLPISLPVWFVTVDHRIYVSGPVHTKKFARIRRDPRVSFLVETGEHWSELLGVHLTGTARIITDDELIARVAALQTEKYARFRMPREQMPGTTQEYYEALTTTIEIIPDDRILSWENARLFRDR